MKSSDDEVAMEETVRTEGTFWGAFLAAQQEFQAIVKNQTATVYSKKTNSKYTFDYADYADVLGMARPVLNKHHLVISNSYRDGELCVAVYMAGTGYSTSSSIRIPENLDYQEFGKAMTYYQRYLLSALLGVASQDDVDHGELLESPKKKGSTRREEPRRGNGRPRNDGPPDDEPPPYEPEDGPEPASGPEPEPMTGIRKSAHNGKLRKLSDVGDTLSVAPDHEALDQIWSKFCERLPVTSKARIRLQEIYDERRAELDQRLETLDKGEDE